MATVFELGGVTVDLDDNLRDEIDKFGGEMATPNVWATEFAATPPLFHVGTPEGIRAWAKSDDVVLQSHARLHGRLSALHLPENTPGRTCEEDVKRGLDGYVFASLGRLALEGIESFAAIVLDPSVLSQGNASLHELAAFDNVLLSPSERFGEHDEAELAAVNQRAFERYMQTLVPGEQFHHVFSRYLSRHFRSVAEYLSTHDFIPGKPDIPPRGSIAHNEMIARERFHVALGLPRPLESVEGYSYYGPQLIVPDQIEKQYVQQVLVYTNDNNDMHAPAVVKAVERADIPATLLRVSDVVRHRDVVETGIFNRGSVAFKEAAMIRALFNLAFVAATQGDRDVCEVVK